MTSKNLEPIIDQISQISIIFACLLSLSLSRPRYLVNGPLA
jgi:hypothetical protein